MACKLKCPNCKTVCKEEGDEMKEAQGTYVVTHGASENILKCNVCKAERAALSWIYD